MTNLFLRGRPAIQSQVISDLELKAGDDMLLDVKDSKIIIRKRI